MANTINFAVGLDARVSRPLCYESSWQLYEEPIKPVVHPLEDVDIALEIAEMAIFREKTTGWDRMIATKTYGLVEPDPYVMEKVSVFKRDGGIRKVLDLGCGQGRHTLLLAKEGFQTFALDISPSAVATTKNALEREGVPGRVTVDDMKEMDYPDDYFDVVLAWRVLYLEKIRGVQKSFEEAKRILRSGGILHVSIRSTNNTLCHIGKRKGEEVEPHTYLMNSDGLSGIVYHFFTEEEVVRYLSDLEVLELEELELQHTEYTARYPEYKNLFWVALARRP